MVGVPENERASPKYISVRGDQQKRNRHGYQTNIYISTFLGQVHSEANLVNSTKLASLQSSWRVQRVFFQNSPDSCFSIVACKGFVFMVVSTICTIVLVVCQCLLYSMWHPVMSHDVVVVWHGSDHSLCRHCKVVRHRLLWWCIIV